MRLGSIEFINSLPVDLGILSGEVSSDHTMVVGTPAQLNAKLLSGDLDMSPVSAFSYAEHPNDWLLLPDLSISSESGVDSVLLFSRHRFKDLYNKEIRVTAKGRTTPVLLEILCRIQYGFAPRVKQVDFDYGEFPVETDAMLLIGDQALAARHRLKDASVRIYDLAEEWRLMSRHALVFAVWAVRREIWEKDPQEVLETYSTLLRSKHWGLGHREAVIRRAIEKTELPKAVLEAYFLKLSYHFGRPLQDGLQSFFEYARIAGLLKTAPKPEFIQAGVGHV